MTRTVLAALALAAFAAAIAACTSSSGDAPEAGACPQDLPASCPTPTPSWDADIQPLVGRRCTPCHFPGGQAFPAQNFTTYDEVYKRRSAMLNQVYGCVMPPVDAGQLTDAERQALLGWLVCHAPNN